MDRGGLPRHLPLYVWIGVCRPEEETANAGWNLHWCDSWTALDEIEDRGSQETCRLAQ